MGTLQSSELLFSNLRISDTVDSQNKHVLGTLLQDLLISYLFFFNLFIYLFILLTHDAAFLNVPLTFEVTNFLFYIVI